jgi:hypothetical protein
MYKNNANSKFVFRDLESHKLSVTLILSLICPFLMLIWDQGSQVWDQDRRKKRCLLQVAEMALLSFGDES